MDLNKLPMGDYDFRMGSKGAIEPHHRAEIARKVRGLSVVTFGLGGLGMIAQAVGWVTSSFLISMAGTGLFLASLVFFTKLRGRHIAFAALGFLSWIGLVIMYFLPKRCLNCTAENSYRSGQCDRCGAPLGI